MRDILNEMDTGNSEELNMCFLINKATFNSDYLLLHSYRRLEKEDSGIESREKNLNKG